jgi:TrmH family RNA methyltransferase
MGSVFHLPVVRSRAVASLIEEWRGSACASSRPCRAAASDVRRRLHRADRVLLGGEGAGCPTDLIAAADTRVSIPMHGAIESLNAAVAAAVLLYEAHATRQAAPQDREGRLRRTDA